MKQKIVFAVLMGSITTCLVSFILVFVNVGLGDAFLWIWMRSWLIANLIAVSVILLLAPKIQLLTNRLCKTGK